MAGADASDNALGAFLRDRRARMDPAAYGLVSGPRRTPGLRREEVAQRAHVSTTWYTWLEQGRGGAPSTAALKRLTLALALNDAERDHLFALAQRRPSQAAEPAERIGPGLRRVLEALADCPAMVRNPVWDVIAWNRAAAVVFGDYDALPPRERNILRLVFADEQARAGLEDWEDNARYIVAAFRAHLARMGAQLRAAPLVRELQATSPDFDRLWRLQEVWPDDDSVKVVRHPLAGALTFDVETMMLERHPGLTLTVFSPRHAQDVTALRRLLAPTDGAARVRCPD